MTDSEKNQRYKTVMWEYLKTSKHVLWDYYYLFGNQWVHINKEKLMELTGKSERQINDILRTYRSMDSKNGYRVAAIKHFTPTQYFYLKKAFRESEHADPEKTTELARKTGLMRHQISTWFSKQRTRRDLSDPKLDLNQEKTTIEYFSINNILSDDFKYSW